MNTCLIEHRGYRFLITDSPTDYNLLSYIQLCVYRGVVAVVRTNEFNYSKQSFINNGISVIDLPYADGHAPTPYVISEWIDIVYKYLSPSLNKNKTKKPCIAIHCVSGLGRAPTLVAIALVELGMDAMDAIQYIRNLKRGSFNLNQLNYIQSYKPIKSHIGCGCVVM
jgi:protein tyrosine phosphatase type IVA